VWRKLTACATARGRTVLLALALVALAAGWAVAESASLYLRIRSAPIRSKPSFTDGEDKGAVYLSQGFEVLDRSKDGDWVKVSFKREAAEKKDASPEEIVGWVHATVLAEKPPAAENAEARLWVQDGAKGLPKEEKFPQALAHAQARRLDLAPVLIMERAYPSAAEVEEFLKAGKLGVYRPDWPSQAGGVAK
jgi:hypothetical protein